MSYEAFSWPEATITVSPGDARAPFVLGFAEGMSIDRTILRAYDGSILRVKDRISIEAVWVEDDTYHYLQQPGISTWIVDIQNQDGRTVTEIWNYVQVASVSRRSSAEDAIRLSIEAEGEPML